MRAVEFLELAASRDPQPATLSDASAARLVLASELSETEQLARGLELSERALEMDPAFPPALFNKALALQQLHFRASARQAWEELLGSAVGDLWKSQAHSQLQALDAAPTTVAESLDRDDFLRLDFLLAIGTGSISESVQDLERKTGDRFFVDVLNWARDGATDPRHRDQIERCLRGYELAVRAYDNRDPRAASLLESSRIELEKLGSPLAWSTGVMESFALRRLGTPSQVAQAAELAQQLASSLASRGYVWLASRAHWSLATTAYRSGDLYLSNVHYERSSELARIAGDSRSHVAVTALLAEGLFEAGRLHEAWDLAGRAVEGIQLYGKPYQRASVMRQIALIAEAAGLPHAAIAFQREALMEALDSEDAYVISDAHTILAYLLGAVGRSGEALDHIGEAERWAHRIEVPELARDTLASTGLAVGSLSSIDPELRIEALVAASDSFDRTANLPQATLSRALLASARVDAGDPETAMRELEEVIGFVEAYGASLPDLSQRNLLLDHHRIYETTIRLLVDAGRAEEALLVAERELYASLQRGQEIELPGPEDLAILRSRLANDGVLLFREVDQRLLGWLLTAASTELVVDLPMDEIRFEVEKLSEAPASLDLETWEKLSARLYLSLFGSIGHRIASLDSLTIVAGGRQGNVPFAGLRNSEQDRFLADEVTVLRSPSLFFSSSERHSRPAPSIEFAALGDPEFNEFSVSMARLPQARQEVETVAAWMGGGSVYVGKEVTSGVFLAELSRARRVHYAGHAVVDPNRPWRSHFLLSRDGGSESVSDGRLRAEFLLGQPMAADLVVLSACDSAVTMPVGAGAAGVTLALPFLAGGVSHVVGVLAPIEDRAAMRFFDLFYRRVAETGDVAASIREAQLAGFEDPDIRQTSFYFSLNYLLQGKEDR